MKLEKSKNETSFGNGETKIEDDSEDIASETGLVGAVDRDDQRLTGFVPFLYLNDVVVAAARHHHDDVYRQKHCTAGTGQRE